VNICEPRALSSVNRNPKLHLSPNPKPNQVLTPCRGQNPKPTPDPNPDPNPNPHLSPEPHQVLRPCRGQNLLLENGAGLREP
jgi:hypothetical protein